MKKNQREKMKKSAGESRHCLAILALVGEMARRLNDNISNVRLAPLKNPWVSAAEPSSGLAEVDTSTG